MDIRTINNLKETEKFAREFASSLVGGDIVLLDGDLGAGKTTFVSYVCQYLGVEDQVNSPTFTIMKHYTGTKYNIIHCDVYRLGDDVNQVEEIGLEDYIYNRDKNTIIFIEWSQLIEQILHGEFKKVVIKRLDENKRSFVVKD